MWTKGLSRWVLSDRRSSPALDPDFARFGVTAFFRIESVGLTKTQAPTGRFGRCVWLRHLETSPGWRCNGGRIEGICKATRSGENRWGERDAGPGGLSTIEALRQGKGWETQCFRALAGLVR